MPAGTKVFDAAGQALGAAPGTIELPRGSEPSTLVLRKAGYRDATVTVTPDADARLDVPMQRKRKKINRDLESPFPQ